jgi:hypothetical protein
MRHFCPCDRHMFKVDAGDIHCPHCDFPTRFDAKGHPQREALYFDLGDFVQRMVRIPTLKAAILAQGTRCAPPGVYRDAVDGSVCQGTGESAPLFAGQTADQRAHTLVLTLCTDATTVGNNVRPVSMTPITALVQSLPQWLRGRFTLMYLAGCLPKRAKDPVFLRPVADMLAELRPGGPGITVCQRPISLFYICTHAHTVLTTKQVDGETWWVVKGGRTDDLGGIAGGINAKQHGAYCGACLQCQIKGTRVRLGPATITGADGKARVRGGAMYYPGAIRYVPHTEEGDTLRTEFKTAFRLLPSVAALADKHAPPKMTRAKALASAERAEALHFLLASQTGDAAQATREALQSEPFHGHNVWTETLSYFDIISQSANDPYHEIVNTVRDIFNLMRSTNAQAGQMHFSQSRRGWENALGRFLPGAHGGKGTRASFQVSSAARDALDVYVQQFLRLPSAWPRIRYVFQYMNRSTCSELIFLAGPMGLYFLQFCDVTPAVRDAFTSLLNCLELLQAYEHTDVTLRALQGNLVMVLATCECLLPFYWNTTVRHVLLHLTRFIKRFGPFNSFSMSVFERYHTVFKKLVRYVPCRVVDHSVQTEIESVRT